MKRIVLIIGIGNNPIKQDLGNTEDTIECPNQIVEAFLLQSIKHAVLHYCDGLVSSPILVVFLL